MRIAAITLAAALGLAAPAFAQDVRPLVDAEWLKANAGQENLVILDIRDDVEETELGSEPYIAKAVAAPYATAGWRTEVDGVPGMLPPVDQVAGLIGSLGIDNDDHVVIVPWGTDSSEFGGATRVYWTFKYLGHDAVSILDGGWRQYDAAGGARSAEPVKPEPVEFTYELQDDLLATSEEVAAALESGVKLVDGRPAEQYEGKSKSPVVRVEGTLPGAVNIEHSKLYRAEYALFARPETVRTLAEEVALGTDEENIAFCNTGHWASIAWFGLSEVLGNKNTSMYDGSMSEWTADPSRPVENRSGT
ncbi:sulfurtransferase [Chelativorans sp. AA-79]|uniref:sulfurtransferase n=1 Tax=Chelativorans sp. AA-79 TaxID=3028735 RepID=UPI0023F7C777|nr:sulfurtransferase [Chelativorans sp. AA-79]WEX09806.1 sulfurtransferase [Chelativorans sp. AA-79]